MQGISFKAVILGTVAVFALDILAGSVLVGIFSDGLTPEMTEQELDAVFAGLIENGAYLFWGAVLGTLTTVIGGYVAARTARSLPYKNAFAFGLLGILIGSFMMGGLPLWYNMLWIVTTLPAALCGAYIAKRRMVADKRQ
jgi:MFS family permease